MVRSARIALVILAAMMVACSSQGNSVAPTVPQQPAIQQPQSIARSTIPVPFLFGEPVDIAHARAAQQGLALPEVAPVSKNCQPMNLTDPIVPAETQSPNVVVAGPPVYIADINKRLWKVTTGTNTIKLIGNEGVLITDLGIDPVNHVLYGVSFTSLYRISETTGRATFVARLAISTANALVFAKNGLGFVAGENNYGLYDMNSSGRMGYVGSMYPFTSAGDLTFYDGYVVLSGQEGGYNGSAADDLILLNPATGEPLEAVNTGLRVLFGLYSPATNELYGFANTSLYHFTSRVLLVKNFASAGVGQIYGAAYDGDFQN
jgi:hypothetical protein